MKENGRLVTDSMDQVELLNRQFWTASLQPLSRVHHRKVPVEVPV